MAESERLPKITIRLPRELLEEIRRLVDEGKYAGITDFIREAVREKLESVRR